MPEVATPASVAVAIISAAVTIYTVVRGSRGEKRGQDWQRITDLWDRCDKQDQRIDSLEARVAALHDENRGQAAQISRLEKALAAARRYIDSLLAMLRLHDITPPTAPADYDDH